MTLEESQEYARNQWPNKKEFDLCRPGKTVKAKWLDAYFGFIILEGLEGLTSIGDIKRVGEFWCEVEQNNKGKEKTREKKKKNLVC